MRVEKDFLGAVKLPSEAMYGINALRASENFPDGGQFPVAWYKAVGLVKLAVYNVYMRFKAGLLRKYGADSGIELMSDEKIRALAQAAEEISEGRHFRHFIVSAHSGGAGTAQNMNINEIIANRALQICNRPFGDYDYIDPIEHANIYQSTNDVMPTALKTAAMGLLNKLEAEINSLRSEIEKLESKYRNTLRIAYTQMQEAVPSTYGRLFSGYNEALSRDWWRVSKCFERIKQVNIGGSAIGTGLTVPRYFLMEVPRELSRLSELPISRAENLTDATANLDSIVEVHAILKAHAVNMEKMCSDMRLLAADVRGTDEVCIPKMQIGSSIMPGKVNPVIVEYAVTSAWRIYSADETISRAAGQGCLDLNAYLPTLGTNLLESISLLTEVNRILREKLFSGIEINPGLSEERVYKSPVCVTALLPYIGYEKAGLLGKEIRTSGCSIFDANDKLKLIDSEKMKEIMKPDNLLKEGFVPGDLK